MIKKSEKLINLLYFYLFFVCRSRYIAVCMQKHRVSETENKKMFNLNESSSKV
jgi:hypothetical protein